MIYMTYILQRFLKAISILMSPFTNCVIKKGNGKYILRIKSFTDEDTKLIVHPTTLHAEVKRKTPQFRQ